MSPSSALDILLCLNDIDTPSEQATLLLNLKNEIVGHPLRKKECVEHGAVQLLAGVLKAQNNGVEKMPQRPYRRDAFLSKQAAFRGAVEVITVLANGKTNCGTVPYLTLTLMNDRGPRFC